MSFRKILTALGVGVLLLSIAVCPRIASADDELWTTSFEKAKELAAEKKLDILMEFTGSDWCPPCIALHKNVLTQDVFKTEAPKKFVLLKLDNPRDKSKQTEEEQAQYKELSAKHNVTGVPTILLTDAQGVPYAKKVGYGGTKAEEYVADLTKSTAAREQRDEFVAKAKDAEGAEKAKLLDKALSGIDAELVVANYEATVKEIIEADADNSAGLKEAYENKLKLPKIQAELTKLQRSFDKNAPEATLDAIQKLIEDMQLEGETLQEALYLKGFIQFQTNDKEASEKTLEAALKLAPDSAKGKQIDRILKSVFKKEDTPKEDDQPKEE